MHVTKQVEPGDRYSTTEPCCSTCLHRSDASPSCYLAVEPYSFVFRAPAKGRWCGLPVLALCVQEFAYVPPPQQSQPAQAADAPTTTLDHRVTLPAYMEEMAEGLLWLQNRETECRATGETYKRTLIALHAERQSSPSPEADWVTAKRWLNDLPSEADADAILNERLPKLLPLRQKDVVMHKVWRQEGRMFADEPLQILRCDLAQREANRRGAEAGFAPALLVLSKPSGLPVHPSGRYRKNSCTSILEDVFGGGDAHRYEIREEFLDVECGGEQAPQNEGQRQQILVRGHVVHKRDGFTLITVGIQHEARAQNEALHTGGVSVSDWALLKQLFLSAQSKAQGEGVGGSEAEPLAPLKAFVVHRLDAATSGVLLFGLDQPTARATAMLISQKNERDGAEGEKEESACAKTYLAIVHGHLDTAALSRGSNGNSSSVTCRECCWWLVDRPIGCLSFHQSLYWCPGERRARQWRDEQQQQKSAQASAVSTAGDVTGACSSGAITAHRKGKDAATVSAKNERMRLLSQKGRGVKRPRTDEQAAAVEAKAGEGKERNSGEIAFLSTLRTAATLLHTVSYSAERNETVVACRLLTGRTHQLRVHLGSLGHPIVGDTKYVEHVARLAAAREKHAAMSEEDDVFQFYRTLADKCLTPSPSNEEGSVGEDGDRGNGACVCPERICLHAWRYKLAYSLTNVLEFVAPPHDEWLRSEAARVENEL